MTEREGIVKTFQAPMKTLREAAASISVILDTLLTILGLLLFIIITRTFAAGLNSGTFQLQRLHGKVHRAIPEVNGIVIVIVVAIGLSI